MWVDGREREKRREEISRAGKAGFVAGVAGR